MTHTATAFAPACVGNLGVGFDILGHVIEGVGDTATVRRNASGEVRVVEVTGRNAERIPRAAHRNTAGVALTQFKHELALPFGFDIHLHKGIALGSGMAGSAASCVAALVAANALLDTPLAQEALYPFAIAGESIASGAHNGDNVGPMLTGGLALATSTRLVPLDVPDWLHAAVVHPAFELETLRAREVLKSPYPLDEVVEQSAHLALLLTGLARSERALIAEGLQDVLVEPRRAALIPGFAQVKQAAVQAGALGCSLSGAGPSMFAWFDDRHAAEAAGQVMAAAFEAAGLAARCYTSAVNAPAAKVVLLAA